MKKFLKKMTVFLPDSLYLRIKYQIKFHRKLRLHAPAMFNEKLQWLKLYDRRPEYIGMADKYEAKSYVARKIGQEYIIPTLGVWDCFENIDFETLPDSFVLKCTHDCGSVVICRDKKEFDKTAAKKKLSAAMKKNYFWGEREWPYKNIPPRILAEQYLEDSSGQGVRDYKFFCFDGVVHALFVATDRYVEGTEVKFDFFDENFNHLPIRNGHDNAAVPPECPACFQQMKHLAAALSEGIPHVRVDFYEVNGKIYFGELTFFHFGGFVRFEPEEWDEIFGSWLVLPEKNTLQQ